MGTLEIGVRQREITLFRHVESDELPSFTSSIFVAEIRKPPDVAQPDNLPRHCQEELGLAGPLPSGVQAVCSGLLPVGESRRVELLQRLLD